MSGLAEGGVGGKRNDDLGPGDALLGASPVPGGLDGHEDALGTPRGHVAGGFGVMEKVGRHRDDFRLELLEALEGAGAEAVGVEGCAVGLLQDVADVLAGKVHEGEYLAAPPVGIARDGVVEAGPDLLAGGALFGELQFGAPSGRMLSGEDGRWKMEDVD